MDLQDTKNEPTSSPNSSSEEPDLGLWSTILFNTSEPVKHEKSKPSGTKLGVFEKLPFEIRAQIWGCFMPDVHKTPEKSLLHYYARSKPFFRTAVSTSENWLAILRTSQQINDEISELLYQRRPLRVRIHPYFGGDWRKGKRSIEWEVEPKNGWTYGNFESDFFTRFKKMRIDLWTESYDCWQHDGVLKEKAVLRECVSSLAMTLAKAQKIPQIKLVIRKYNLVDFDYEDLTQPSHTAIFEEDIKAVLGPILHLKMAQGGVEIQSIHAVENLRRYRPFRCSQFPCRRCSKCGSVDCGSHYHYR